MFYQTDSVKTSYFTVKNYDGTFLPEMVSEAPESASYTELTEVIISAARITPMKNNWYHLSPEFDIAVDVHDTHRMIDNTSNAEFFHIIYMTKHIHDAQSGAFLHSEPFVIYAGAFMGNEEASAFSGIFYVLNGKSELVFDTGFKDYDAEYLNAHPEISREYIITVNYRITNFNALSLSHNAVCFHDGKYYETPINDKSCQFLFLDGIENVLNGHMLSFISIKGYYDYEESNWFLATDYLYNNMELVN